MAQAPAALTPLASAQHYFGAELRRWRRLRGMSLATLGNTMPPRLITGAYGCA